MKFLNKIKLSLTSILLGLNIVTFSQTNFLNNLKSPNYSSFEKNILLMAKDSTYANSLTLLNLKLLNNKWYEIFSRDSSQTIFYDRKTNEIINIRETIFVPTQITSSQSNSINKLKIVQTPYVYPTESTCVLPSQHDVDMDILNKIHLIYTGKEMPEIKSERPIGMFFGKKNKIIEAIKRMSPFIDYKIKRLNEKKMHPSFLIIPIIESMYNPWAQSSSKATGAYQIMYLTGKGLGLTMSSRKINGKRVFDYRRHHIESFEKASNYMNELEKTCEGFEFLAPAKYNYGPNRKSFKNINSPEEAIEVMKHLNTETKNYVPEIIAVQQVLSELVESKEFQDFEPDKIRIDTIDKKIKISEIEDQLHITKEIFFKLNPQYLPTNKDNIYYLSKGRKIILPRN